MTLVALRKVPRSKIEWEAFHFQHWTDHKIILAVVAKKTNTKLFMPPIWPVLDNVYTPKIAQFHQILHEQMNAVSGAPSSDMLNVDLATPSGQLNFIEPNYRDHLVFHQFVGIPV